MTSNNGVHTLGPDSATLQVKTYRQGVASKAGHDLVLDVTRWHATVNVGDGAVPLAIELSVDPRSLYAREGHRGVKPLTDKDRDDIRKNIQAKVLGTEPIEFRSTGVEAAGDGRLSVRGDLAIAGNTRPTTFELRVGAGGEVSGVVSLTQSEWGIKPYSALMGALKVRDSIDVVLDAKLPAG